MTQTGTRPPRFAIQVNSRTRVTRDYAYFVENRLRRRYGMDGVPLVIDFNERAQRRSERSAARPRGRAGR
jgi:GTPase